MLELVDKFIKIVPSAFGPFGVACMFENYFFKEIFYVFITLQNYVNAEFDKTEMLINLKDRNYQRK